jgi:hypothetical protein
MVVVRVVTYADEAMDVKGAKILRERLAEAEVERSIMLQLVEGNGDVAEMPAPTPAEPTDDAVE